MKLVDILARELKVWPENAPSDYCCQSDSTTEVFFGNPAKSVWLSERADITEDVQVTRAQWQAAVDALKAENCSHLWVGWSDTEACELCNKTRKIVVEWDGFGSPPMGALVQDHSDVGGPVYIAEVVSVEDGLVAIKRPGSLKVVDFTALRPVRTPERITAETRKKEILKMIDVFGTDTSIWGLDAVREICGYLWEAGYRKPSATDN